MRDSSVGEHGAGRHVANGDFTALDHLMGEYIVLSAWVVRSVGDDCHRFCAVSVHGNHLERFEAQLPEKLLKHTARRFLHPVAECRTLRLHC